MAAKQQANASISNLMNLGTTTLSIETRTLSDSNKNIICDVSTGPFRPIVPESMRKQVFDVFHSLSHPGIRATRSTGWPKSRYTVIKVFFMRFEITSSALYVAQK